jgi:LytR cell envelope-related transcriptional attenuator
MFTPVGAGGRPPGRRSRWRRVLAVLMVMAVVAGFVLGGAWWLFGGGQTGAGATTTPEPSVSCRTPEPRLPDRLPRPADVKLELLNGTDQSGLATQTADAMVLLGFDVVAFGNADNPVVGVAVVTYGKGDLGDAVVVASYLPGAQLKQVARNTGGVVTATLGPQFAQVATPAEARANVDAVVLPTPSPICS